MNTTCNGNAGGLCWLPHLCDQMVQNLQLHSCLMMKPCLVPDDLHRSQNLILIVITFQHLSKRALAKDAYNFKSVCKVVMSNWPVVPSVIVKSSIVLRCTHFIMDNL